MQHKRNTPVKTILGVTIIGLLFGAAIFLMTSPIPAPEQPIEKELDASSLLDVKQP